MRRYHLFQDHEDMNFATSFPDSEEAGQAEIQDMPSKVYIKFYIRLVDSYSPVDTLSIHG